MINKFALHLYCNMHQSLRHDILFLKEFNSKYFFITIVTPVHMLRETLREQEKWEKDR